MMTIEEIKKALKDANIAKVAKGSGLHYNVVYRMVNGGTKTSYETVKKLSDYLEQ